MKYNQIRSKIIALAIFSSLSTSALALTYTTELETTDEVNKIIVRAEMAPDVYAVVKCGISTGTAKKDFGGIEDVVLSLTGAPSWLTIPLEAAIAPLTLDKSDSYCIAWNVPTPKAGPKSANAARNISNVQTWVKENGSIKPGPSERPKLWCGVDSSAVCYEIVSTNGANVLGVSTCVETLSKDDGSVINSVIVSLGETPPEFSVTKANAVESKKCSDRNEIWQKK